MSDKFEYGYTGENSPKKKEAERIREKYLPEPKQDEKMKKLKKLNAKVENAAKVAGLFTGITGTLIFGLGLTMILEWQILIWGIVVSVAGFVPLCLAYYCYQKIYKKQKAKYASEILQLSEEILNEKD